MNKCTKGVLYAVTAFAGLMLASCADQPDKYEIADGIPTIKYIRCTSSEISNWDDADGTHYTNGELVTSASPQSTLCIVGDNLRSITEIWFNNLPAVLNTSYITDNTLIVNIPKNVPTEVSDKIYFITSAKDTVTYDFHVVIPKPTVTTMSNEYASVGEEVTLYGNYYISDPNVPLKVEFTGNDGKPVSAEVTNIDPDFANVSVKIPEGAVSGPVSVTSVYGTTVAKFHYKDQRGLLFTFDDGRVNNGWKCPMSAGIKTDDTAISGNFLQFGNGEIVLENTWNDGEFEFDYWPGAWRNPETFEDPATGRLFDYVDFSNWENMALKFEIYVPEEHPWTGSTTNPLDGSPMQVIFMGTDMVSQTDAGITDIYGNVLGGGNNTFFHDDSNGLSRAFYRPWAEVGEFHTGGKWQTVVLPLQSSWIYDYNGQLISNSLKPSSFAGFEILLWSNAGAPSSTCTPIIKIDNIRAVPYK